MLLTPLLERFAAHFPIPTMARAVLERSFHPDQLNTWFETVAQGQYSRWLLFSTLFDLMLQVVTRQQPSIHAAYQGAREAIPVTLRAVYDKLNGLEPETSAVLVREHQQIPCQPLEPMRLVATTAQGQLSEQRVTIPTPDGVQRLELRRIRLELNTPTREGETSLYLLTTLPEAVDAVQVAALYRERWTLEKAFLHVTTELRCEIETLAYPPAALFGLAMAVVAYNALAVIKATLLQVHGAETIETEVSGYSLVNEIARVGESLNTLVTPEEWAGFQTLTTEAMAAWLLATAQQVQLRKYRKHPRGQKKPAPARTHDPSKPHLSVARLLAQRQPRKTT